MSENTNYLAGMQEVVGKTVGFAITTIGFVIYAFARDQVVLTPVNVLAYLALFWFLYELLTFMMYMLFSLFMKGGAKQAQPVTNNTSTTIPSQKDQDNDV
jgi:hypothetical protein